MKSSWTVAALMLPAVALPALGQSALEQISPPVRLINIETNGIPGPGTLAAKVDVRLFGGDEGTTYTSLELRYGFVHRFEGILRGSVSDKRDFPLPGNAGTIRHGGNDLEIAGKYQLDSSGRLAVLAGISFPGTPAQSQAAVTLGASYAHPTGRNLVLYLNPRSVFIDHNTIVGIGLGASIALAPSTSLMADWTPIATGDNTRNTVTGGLKSRGVYGAALRISSHGSHGAYTLDIGYSTGVGSTTGFSLTPGLGGSGAFYVALTAHH